MFGESGNSRRSMVLEFSIYYLTNVKSFCSILSRCYTISTVLLSIVELFISLLNFEYKRWMSPPFDYYRVIRGPRVYSNSVQINASSIAIWISTLISMLSSIKNCHNPSKMEVFPFTQQSPNTPAGTARPCSLSKLWLGISDQPRNNLFFGRKSKSYKKQCRFWYSNTGLCGGRSDREFVHNLHKFRRAVCTIE